MLNQNFALSTASIHRANRPDIVPAKNVDFLSAMRQAGEDYEKAQHKAKLDALATALKGKDHEQIDNAYADIDPYGRAGWLYDRNAKVEDRDAGFQHAYNMADKQLQNSIALSDHNLGNSKNLAQFNASLKQQAAEREKAAVQAEIDKRLGILDNMHENGTISDMQYIGARSKLLNLGLEMPKQTTIKDFATAAKDLASANVDIDTLNQYAALNGFEGLKFKQPEKKYTNGDVGLVQMMTDDGMSLSDALTRVGKMTPEEKLDYETKKAYNTGAIKFGYDSALENQKQTGQMNLANLNSQNSLNNNIVIEGIKNENVKNGRLQQFNLDLQKIQAQNELDLQKMRAQNELNKDFETYKSELPTETIRNAQQTSALTGEPVQNLLLQAYNQHKVEWQQKLADIEYKQAQTAKIRRENEQPYLSPIEEHRQKAEIDAAIKQRQLDAKEAKEKAEKEENTARAMAVAQNGLNELKNVADSKDLSPYQGATQYMPWSGKSVQKAKGKTTASIAAIAPAAIQRLKDAGVSGVNTLGEFMTYVGLPQNPTSEEIAAAIPIIADILGLENPYDNQFVEGTVIENDKGEKMILRGGEWQKI